MHPTTAESKEHSTNWADARAGLLLSSNVTYLNTGSFGPISRRVYDRVATLRKDIATEPMDFFLRQVPSQLWHARCCLAKFIGGDPCRLALTTNVTSAVNLIASSLSLKAPGEILLTDNEYATMQWCWERSAKRQGLVMRSFSLPTMPSHSGEIIEAAVQAMSSSTRLLFLSHVLSSTGMILPVREICSEAQRRGIVTVVDGAHGPAFTDLNLTDIGCDFYVGSGHKWLLAPTGTGFLYLGKPNEDRLEPLQVSWGYRPKINGDTSDERDASGSTPRLRRIECEGTRDITPWLALPEAIGFLSDFGRAEGRARMCQLADYVRSRLQRSGRLVSTTPDHHALYGGMTAFAVPKGIQATKLQGELWKRFRVEVGVADRPNGSMIRVSTHFFNTETEVDLLAECLDEMLKD